MITVFTIVYNNYGRFIPQWVEWLKKQTIKPKLLIVLGKEHGADIEYLKDNNIKYVLCDSDNMGKLRNAGLEQVKTKWWMYFSVDDELLPNACEEIVNSDADAVSLKFNVIELNGTIKEDCHSPHITTLQELNNWSRCWGGYVAVKENNDIRFREDIEVPNLTLHFELFKRRLKVVESDNVLAIHHRWSESHHFRSKNIRKSFVDEIEKTKNEIIEEMINGSKKLEVEVIKKFHDLTLLKKGQSLEKAKKSGKILRKKGTILILSKERAKQLMNSKYAILKRVIE